MFFIVFPPFFFFHLGFKYRKHRHAGKETLCCTNPHFNRLLLFLLFLLVRIICDDHLRALLTLAGNVEGNGDNDDRALDDLLDVRVDTDQVHDVLQECDDERTGDGSGYRSLIAGHP